MNSDLDLIVDSLKFTRNRLLVASLFSFLWFVVCLARFFDDPHWLRSGAAIVFAALTLFPVAAILYFQLLASRDAPVLRALAQTPEQVFWIRYNPEALQNGKQLIWIRIYFASDRPALLGASSKQGESVIRILQEQAPDADFGDSKEMAERYKARVKSQ
jgi:hypothetical protein